MKFDTKEIEASTDFEGTFKRDSNSNFRKRVSRIKASESDPIMFGKILAKTGSRRVPFCADTGCSVNILPAKFAAAGGLKWKDLNKDESTYRSVTNEDLTIIGQTTAFIKLDLIKHPVMLEFLVCTDDGDEGLLSLDTLKELTIIPRDFPLPMDRSMREPRVRRIKETEEEAEVEKAEKLKHFDLKERVGSMRSKLEMNQMGEEDWEEERKCEELKKQWLRDFSDIFKEDLTKEDRIDIEPIKIDLVENHAEIPTFKPKTAMDVSPYMEQAAKKELACMIDAGMLEEIDYYT